eukprot:948478-Pyramimonas_sp.AAC.1
MSWTSPSSSSSSRRPSQVLKLSPPSSGSSARSSDVPNDGNVPLISGLRPRGNVLRQPATPTTQGTLSIETFNASGGRATLKSRLERTNAMIVLCQEIGFTEETLEALCSWVAGRRWRCSAIPARATSGSILSGGVA